LGPLGQRIATVALGTKGLKIVGAVDIAKEIVGKDLGEVLGLDKKLGVIVTDDPDSLLATVKADIAIVATTSYVKTVYPTIEKCIKAGLNIISTCEQLAYPWIREPQLASQIDGLAKKYGVTVLSTGINPGYFMDTLPLIFTAICREVKSIEATRAIATGTRRESFQKKIGTGLTVEEFKAKLEKGEITGHVGGIESVALTAAALGLDLDEIRELPPEPIIAREEVQTTYTTVKPGQMLGYTNIIQGIKDGKVVINYKIVMSAGIKEGYQEYKIEGTPSITVRSSSIVGDWETAHIVVNMIPNVINAEPGLLTMKDVALPHAIVGDLRTFIMRA
ncbi:MAG: NADP-binding protein, partial [Candidatus Bathyarchaeia archaeon]